MNLRPITLIIVFIIFTGIYGIYEFKDDWSNATFFSGVLCGLPLLTCYLGNRYIGTLLFLLGILSLQVMATGALGSVEPDRLFFIGLSLGALFGWVPALFILRKQTSALLAKACHSEGYESLTQFFERHSK